MPFNGLLRVSHCLVFVLPSRKYSVLQHLHLAFASEEVLQRMHYSLSTSTPGCLPSFLQLLQLLSRDVGMVIEFNAIKGKLLCYHIAVDEGQHQFRDGKCFGLPLTAATQLPALNWTLR
jgi:hypothetical protein